MTWRPSPGWRVGRKRTSPSQIIQTCNAFGTGDDGWHLRRVAVVARPLRHQAGLHGTRRSAAWWIKHMAQLISQAQDPKEIITLQTWTIAQIPETVLSVQVILTHTQGLPIWISHGKCIQEHTCEHWWTSTSGKYPGSPV